MHDPRTVAFDIKNPIPKRSKWRERQGDPRWTLRRVRFTNPEHAHQAVYPWWRVKAWDVRLAGRAYHLRDFITVWHVEPRNRDTNPPCGSPRWRWHITHWRIQIRPLQRFIHRFARCAECGRRMNTASRHSYMSSPKGTVWHDECMTLRHLRSTRQDDEGLIRALFAAYRVATDLDEADALERFRHLPDTPGNPHSGFRNHYRLEKLLGWDRDDKYRLVKKEASGG